VQAKFEVEKYVYARKLLTQRRKGAKKAFEARQRFAPLRE